MLRLTDARTGATITLGGPGPRPLQVGRCGCAPGPVVLADLVRRLGELRRMRVTVRQFPCPAQDPGIDPMAWNAHPPATPAGSDPPEVYAGPHLPDGPPPRVHLVREPPVPPATPAPGDEDAHLTARLLLLAERPIPDAGGEIARLRARTARLAESPSGAPPAARIAEIAGALEDDLAVARAWGLLVRLSEDEGVAPGARFEAVAHLDRLFGLELARDVGRV